MKLATVITIDGPSGSGKGTVGQLLAQKLGWHFLDSGALYRVLALAAQKHHIDLKDEVGLEQLARELVVEFVIVETELQIIFDGEDVTDTIRAEAVGSMASQLAVLPGVRSGLLDRQRAFRKEPGLIADGRDMGTVVFPDAKVKFFLTAGPEERARRRYNQLLELGISVKLAALIEEITQRDRRDEQRTIAPMKPAEDAIVIDTTDLTISEVLDRVMTFVE